jgi:hypothetical protein
MWEENNVCLLYYLAYTSSQHLEVSEINESVTEPLVSGSPQSRSRRSPLLQTAERGAVVKQRSSDLRAIFQVLTTAERLQRQRARAAARG